MHSVLHDGEVDIFIRDGFVVVRDVFDADIAASCRSGIWDALAAHGHLPNNPATWTKPCIRVPCPDGPAFAAIAEAPALVQACDQLIGVGRWEGLNGAGGDVPVRFPSEDWPGDTGYHIEGNWWGGEEYWTGVTSPGRGLTALILFEDVDAVSAPTRLVYGSHRFIAPVLAAAGPDGMAGSAAAQRLRPSVLCRQVTHATGCAGDIYLCHPFLVHTPTWPHRGRHARIMSQPRINAPDGFRLDGTDPSPVARAIMLGLTPEA